MIIYVIDSSALIDMKRTYPVDVFPGVWSRLENLVENGRLIAPQEVLFELQKRDDELTEWVKEHDLMFKEPTATQINIVQQILAKFPSFVKLNRKHDADPWVVALAYNLVKAKQSTINGTQLDPIVVAHETLDGNKVKIPYVCQNYGLQCIKAIEMFRKESWTFF
jgi:rRNA maturation endonuclease Nob1